MDRLNISTSRPSVRTWGQGSLLLRSQRDQLQEEEDSGEECQEVEANGEDEEE